MKPPGALRFFPALLLSLPFLTGCLGLKPSADPTRHFLLAELASTNTPSLANAIPSQRSIGLASVQLPDYLSPSALAIRQSETEIRYNDYAQWAERLDKGLTRVLGANLAALLPADKIVLSPWTREGVTHEIEVKIGRFEVNPRGLAALEASWKIVRPGQSQSLQSGRTRLNRPGPAPNTDTAGAVASLSALLEDFSRQLAQTLRDLR